MKLRSPRIGARAIQKEKAKIQHERSDKRVARAIHRLDTVLTVKPPSESPVMLPPDLPTALKQMTDRAMKAAKCAQKRMKKMIWWEEVSDRSGRWTLHAWSIHRSTLALTE